MDMPSSTANHTMLTIKDSHEQCDGVVDHTMTGSWQGHIGPGLLFVLWGVWTMYHVFERQLRMGTNTHKARTSFLSRSWWPLPFPPQAAFLEPVLKLCAAIGILIELWLDHDQYMFMVCPKGTLHEGRFALEHIHNWQHAANYPPFIVSGMVDLLVHFGDLPHQVSQVFLALAFAIQAFLMGTHTKHIALDQTVHQFVFYTMLGCTVFAILEASFRRTPILAVGRAFFVTLQGAWLCMVSRIMFEDRPAWSLEYMGSSMMCSVFFTMLTLLLAVGFLSMYYIMAHLHHWSPVPGGYAPVSKDVELCEHTLYVSGHDSASDDGRGPHCHHV